MWTCVYVHQVASLCDSREVRVDAQVDAKVDSSVELLEEPHANITTNHLSNANAGTILFEFLIRANVAFELSI